jgi:hypothetical protein
MADETADNPLPASSGEVGKLITTVAALKDSVDALTARVGAVEKSVGAPAKQPNPDSYNAPRRSGGWLF